MLQSSRFANAIWYKRYNPDSSVPYFSNRLENERTVSV